MANQQDSAFVDEFTTSYNNGASYFIQVDPSFTTQIADIASIIARVANADEDPAAFVDSFTTRAQDALPPSAAAPTGEDDESAPAPTAAKDTPDSLAAKRSLLKDLLAPLSRPEAKLQNIPDRDFIGFTNLVLSLLLSLFSEDAAEELAALTRGLVRAIAAENPTPASNSPAMSTRYTALATIFNALPTTTPATSEVGTVRREVLETLVAYAAKNDDLSIVRPALENHQLEQDHLSTVTATEEKDVTTASIVRSLIGNVVDGSRTDPIGTLRLARELLVDRLSNEGSQEETREKLQKTLMALLLASNEVYDFTPFARIVPTTSSEDALSKTFKLFLSGDSSDALPTQADLESALSSSTLIPSSSSSSSSSSALALDRSELEKKLKLLQLARLCEDRVGKEVGYEEIKKRLGLQMSGEGEEGEEVEEWVIDAIRASLVQGRLSQPTHSFFVTRAAPLSFSSSSSQSSDSWRTIEERLQGWKEALERVTGSVEKSLGFAAAGEKAPRREVNGRFAEEVVQNQQQQQAIEA